MRSRRPCGRRWTSAGRRAAAVPAELIFDQGFGDLFVIRVAGNIVAPSQVGSVEFAAARYGTRLVVVMGHSQCGAVLATLEELLGRATNVSQNLRSIVDRVRPSVETLLSMRGDEDFDVLVREAVRANVRTSVDHLRHGSELLERLIRDDRLLIVYTTLRGTNGVYWKPAGGGSAEPLLENPERTLYEAILTRDDKNVIYRLGGIPGDLYYIRRDSLNARRALVTSRFDERSPAISPDDRWLAYVSDETGRDEVYVRPFPEGSARWVISAAGGTEPRWNPKGQELFYRNADTLFAVQMHAQPSFTAGQRTALFTGPYLLNPRHTAYDVHPDGQRFIFISGDPDDPGELILVQNVLSAAARSPAANPKR